jgi:hypothetical protein
MFQLSSLTCNQIWLIPLVDDGLCGYYITKLKGGGGILRTRYVCKLHMPQIRIWRARKMEKKKIEWGSSGVFLGKFLQIAKKKNRKL